MDSYAAGLIDGEGYIGIQRTGASYGVRLKVAMSDKGVRALRRMEKHYGGNVLEQPARDEKHRPTYLWWLTGVKASELIARLRPMFAVKDVAADIALEFQKMVDASPRRPNGTALWTDEMRRKAAVYVDRIQEANRRGADPVAYPDLPMVAERHHGEWWKPSTEAIVFNGKFPVMGKMVNGRVFDLTPPKPKKSTAKKKVAPTTFPTPQTGDSGGPQTREARAARGYGPDLKDVVVHEVPKMLSTTRATDGTEGGPNWRGSSGDQMLPLAVVGLLPTPVVTDSKDTRNSTAFRHDRKPTTNVADTLTDALWKVEEANGRFTIPKGPMRG